MSRTYRNKARFSHLNEEHYINHKLRKFKIRYDVEHYWLPGMEEKYKADYAEYQKRVGWFHKGYGAWRPNEPERWKYRSWRKVLVEFSQEDYDREVEEARVYYSKFSRDGRWNETGRNNGFKHTCTKAERSKTRAIISNIKHGKIDPENVVFPDRKDGKCRIWDFW